MSVHPVRAGDVLDDHWLATGQKAREQTRAGVGDFIHELYGDMSSAVCLTENAPHPSPLFPSLSALLREEKQIL